jgi:hypothetical protein
MSQHVFDDWQRQFEAPYCQLCCRQHPSINTPALELAKKQIDTVNIQRIQDISVGAMVFYSWASGVLDEIKHDKI